MMCRQMIDGQRLANGRPLRGFTLTELMVSVFASSMLLVGLSSALYLTIQATEPDIGGMHTLLRTSRR